MPLLDKIKAKAKNLIPVNGVKEQYIVDPPVKLRSIFNGQIYHVIKLNLITEGHPLLYMAETTIYYNAEDFRIDE